jgi:hypothetical protein
MIHDRSSSFVRNPPLSLAHIKSGKDKPIPASEPTRKKSRRVVPLQV